MQITPPTWDDLRVLLAVYREQSFLGAAKHLGLSTSTVSRRIDALEGSLRRTLVRRGPDGTTLEPDALPLVNLAEQLELGLDSIQRGPDQSAAAGTVRISMGEGFVRPVTRLLTELRTRHPGLQFELSSEHTFVDLARREADIGIRKAPSTSKVLVQRSVGALTFALYAASSYVDRKLGAATIRPEDFRRLDFVGHDKTLARLPQSQWLAARGVERWALRTNSDLAIEEAVVGAMGIAMLADAQARALGGLVRIECGEPLPSLPVYLAWHHELSRVERYRTVIRALEPALRAGLR